MTLVTGTDAQQDPRAALRGDGFPPTAAVRSDALLPRFIPALLLLLLALGWVVYLEARRRDVQAAWTSQAANPSIQSAEPPPLTVPPPTGYSPPNPFAPAPALFSRPIPEAAVARAAEAGGARDRPQNPAASPVRGSQPLSGALAAYRSSSQMPAGDRTYVAAPRSRAPFSQASDFQARGPASTAPALITDNTVAAAASGGAPAATGNAAIAAVAGQSGIASGGRVRAALLPDRAATVPQGAIIAAVLETAINSDQPGPARAIVSRDVRSFDGSRILIPRGSRLLGAVRPGSAAGARRVLVVWTRLIRPDGVTIQIDSPATGTLGQGGLGGSVNTHWFGRVSTAVLQTALGISANIATARALAGGSSIYLGLPTQATQLGPQLAPATSRPATIKVKPGASIAVFVARDLDFSDASPGG